MDEASKPTAADRFSTPALKIRNEACLSVQRLQIDEFDLLFLELALPVD
jgi:hypothetical protein